MQARKLIVGAAFLAACGGKTPTSPPGTGTPTSVAIQAGNNQTGSAGAALPVRPAVLVKDQDGKVLVGVAVVFSVESGGGSLAGSATVSTGSNGVAQAGVWTLGPAEGGNVLKASVGTVSVRILAQAGIQIVIADQQVIGAGGGTIRYANAGNPMNGFTLTVPAGAYSGNQLWTVTAKPRYPVVLPAGLRQVGGAVEISNDQGFAKGLLAIRIPVRVGLDTAVSALIYDPSTGYLEGMGVAARDSVSITVITRHVGNRFLWQPTPASLRGSASSLTHGGLFSGVLVVFASMDLKSLGMKSIGSALTPGLDDFEFKNLGSAITPFGNAVGMALGPLYHLLVIKPLTGQKLSGLLDSIPGFDWDNPQGIRLVSVLQRIFDQQIAPQAQADYQAVTALAAAGQVPLDSLTLTTTEINMLATGQPQVLQLSDPSGSADVVVAFSANNSTNHDVLHVLDTSRPGGVGDSVVLSGGLLRGTKISGLLAGITGSVLRYAMSIGNSSSMLAPSIGSLFQQLAAGTVGDGEFPALSFLAGDSSSFLPKPLAGIARTLLSGLKFENDCPACGGISPALASVFNRLGTPLPNPAILVNGTNRFGILGTDPAGKFVDFRWFTTEARTLTVLPDTAKGFQGDTLTFVAHPQGFAPPGAIYTWSFGDGTTFTSAPGDSTAFKVYSGTPAPGGTHYPVTLTIRDSTTAVVGRANAHARVNEKQIAWRFTSAALSSSQLPLGGIGSEHTDTLIRDLTTGWTQSLVSTPGNSLLFLFHGSDAGISCRALYFEQFPPGQYAPVLDSTFPGPIKGFLASDCPPDPSFVWSLTMGPLGNGTLVGSWVDVPNPEAILVPGGAINATMAGTTLTGTFTVNVRYSTGIARNTYTFQATQVLPPP